MCGEQAKKEVHSLLQEVAKGLLLTERRVAACPVSAKVGHTAPLASSASGSGGHGPRLYSPPPSIVAHRCLVLCGWWIQEDATSAEAGKPSSLAGKDDSVRAVAVDDDDEEEEGAATSPTISFIGPGA